MNKKERAAFDEAVLEARIARALRWSDAREVQPDIPMPVTGKSEGWAPFSYGIDWRVDEMWSESYRHGEKPHPYGTQGGIALYSSRLLALRAVRCQLERRFAKVLAQIDEQIDAEVTA